MIKLAFFRGVDINNDIGASDWRIALFMEEFGFKSYVYGRGKKSIKDYPKIIYKPFKPMRINSLNGFYFSLMYAIDALKEKIEVIICNPGVFLATILLKVINRKIKIILDIRSVPVETNFFSKFLAEINYRFVFFFKTFDALTVISDGMLKDLENKYKIPDDLPKFSWGSAFDENIFNIESEVITDKSNFNIHNKLNLMFHGSLSPNRGIIEMLDALKILKQENFQDIKLSLIGKGSFLEKLKAKSQELDIDEMVFFHDPIPHEELPQILKNADIGFDLLPDLPWWRHQSPLKVFEYLAMGKPVLATDLPCHRNISDAVILIQDNSPGTIAKAIMDFCCLSPERKAEYRDTALRDAKNNTWRSRAKNLSSFLKEKVLKIESTNEQ